MLYKVISALRSRSEGVIGIVFLLCLMAIFYLAWQQVRASRSSGVAAPPKQRANVSEWANSTFGFTVAPNGKSLVFVGNHYNDRHPELANDLWRLDLVTNKVTRLTNSPKAKEAPCFSPDGRWIVYLQSNQYHGDDQINAIYLLTASGGTPRLLTDPKVRLDFDRPAISPDGKQIVVGARLYAGTTRYSTDPYAAKGSHLYLLPTSGKKSLRTATPKLFDSYIHGEFYNANTVVFEREVIKMSFAGSVVIVVESLDLITDKITPLPSLPGNTFLMHATMPNGRILLGNMRMDPTPHHTYALDSLRDSTPRPLPHLPEETAQFKGVPRVGAQETSSSLASSGGNDADVMLYFSRWGSSTGLTGLWRVPLSGGTPEQVADASLMDDPLNWKPPTIAATP